MAPLLHIQNHSCFYHEFIKYEIAAQIPGLVAPDVGLDDDSLLFKETEVFSADEATNVPLDGDCRPCLSVTPFLLHPLVQTLLHKHLCFHIKGSNLRVGSLGLM